MSLQETAEALQKISEIGQSLVDKLEEAIHTARTLHSVLDNLTLQAWKKVDEYRDKQEGFTG